MGYLFQCLPWARSFWAFSPFLNHIRKFRELFYFFSFLFSLLVFLFSLLLRIL